MRLRKKKPRVAIVTATKNRKQHLMRCMDSVSAQTYVNIEHIVVDDQSTDDTWEFLQSAKQQNKHLRPFQIKKSGKGGARGRNFGVQQTRADFITYLDDDDVFYKDHISTLVQHVIEHERCDFAYCAAHKSGDGKNITGIWDTDIWSEDIRAVNLFPICAAVHSRKSWLVVGGMDETIGVYEDWDFWQRLIHHGFIPCFINKPTSIVDSSLSKSIQHDEDARRKEKVGEIIKNKMPNRLVDYRSYLKERLKTMKKVVFIPKNSGTPNHRDRFRELRVAKVDLLRAPFWREIK